MTVHQLGLSPGDMAVSDPSHKARPVQIKPAAGFDLRPAKQKEVIGLFALFFGSAESAAANLATAGEGSIRVYRLRKVRS